MHTPAQAAQIAGVSRSKISRLLKDGKLRGTRNNAGHWRIADDDLKEWLSDVPHTAPAQPEPGQDAQIARLETQVAEKQKQIELLERELADWKSQAQRSWFERLFGKK